MKDVGAALLDLINQTIAGTEQMVDFDCYTLTLASGTVMRFTTADFDITDGTNIWRSDLVRVDEKNSKVTVHWKEGFDVDTLVLVMMPRSVDVMTGATFPDTINGVPWLQAAQGGALDGADFQLDSAVFNGVPTWPMPPTGMQPVGFITGIFAGLVGEVDTNSTICVLNVNDYRCLLDIDTPKHVFTGGCRYTLFDVDCTLSAATFQTAGTAMAGTTPSSIVNALPAPGGSGTYILGRVTMTSGLNNGFSATVTSWAGPGQALGMITPFPFTIVSGDTFLAWPGCAKTQGSCNAFGNILNFGGQTYVPAPEAAY